MGFLAGALNEFKAVALPSQAAQPTLLIKCVWVKFKQQTLMASPKWGNRTF